MTEIISVKVTDLPDPHTKTGCKLCGHTRGYLARYIKSNGNVAVRWICDRCEDYRTAGDLPHTILPRGVAAGALPLRLDHSGAPPDLPDCARCGLRADEFHHWAPSSIFPDWPDLGVYLCFACHREWHDRMRAHGLRWPHELNTAA